MSRMCKISRSRRPFPRACCTATKASRWWWGRRCTSSRRIPNLLYSIDLTKPGGALNWTYAPKTDARAVGIACCDIVNRGAVYADGKIIYNTLDAQTVAVDAKTGKEVWRTRVGDINIGETMTGAPLVVHDKVLVGDSGAELGVRGYLAGARPGDGQAALAGLQHAAPTPTC